MEAKNLPFQQAPYDIPLKQNALWMNRRENCCHQEAVWNQPPPLHSSDLSIFAMGCAVSNPTCDPKSEISSKIQGGQAQSRLGNMEVSLHISTWDGGPEPGWTCLLQSYLALLVIPLTCFLPTHYINLPSLTAHDPNPHSDPCHLALS